MAYSYLRLDIHFFYKTSINFSPLLRYVKSIPLLTITYRDIFYFFENNKINIIDINKNGTI